MNHTNMIGPKVPPILAVPNRCSAKKATRIATVTGVTNGFKELVTTFTPSRALSTEMAGVMTPSP